MKKVLFIVGMVLSVSAIAYVLRGCNNAVSAASATAPTAQPAALMALATQEPTMQPTETPEPTIDYSGVYPAQTQAAAAAISAQALQMRADAASTLLAATPTALAMALKIGTPTAQAMMTEQAVGTQSAYATNEANRQQILFVQTQNDTENQHAKDLADIQVKKFLVFMVATVIAFIVVFSFILLIRWIDRRQWSAMMESVPDVNVLQNLGHDQPAAPSFIPVAENVSHPSNVPVADKVFRVWAERMLAGETAGVNKWETKDSPFGRVGYQDFLAWAERMGYIDETGKGKVLSDKGRNFCAGWLARHPAGPPLNGQIPESA